MTAIVVAGNDQVARCGTSVPAGGGFQFVVVPAGHDRQGQAQSGKIQRADILVAINHYGWHLGRFFLKRFLRGSGGVRHSGKHPLHAGRCPVTIPQIIGAQKQGCCDQQQPDGCPYTGVACFILHGRACVCGGRGTGRRPHRSHPKLPAAAPATKAAPSAAGCRRWTVWRAQACCRAGRAVPAGLAAARCWSR